LGLLEAAFGILAAESATYSLVRENVTNFTASMLDGSFSGLRVASRNDVIVLLDVQTPSVKNASDCWFTDGRRCQAWMQTRKGVRQSSWVAL